MVCTGVLPRHEMRGGNSLQGCMQSLVRNSRLLNDDVQTKGDSVLGHDRSPTWNVLKQETLLQA